MTYTIGYTKGGFGNHIAGMVILTLATSTLNGLLLQVIYRSMAAPTQPVVPDSAQVNSGDLW